MYKNDPLHKKDPKQDTLSNQPITIIMGYLMWIEKILNYLKIRPKNKVK